MKVSVRELDYCREQLEGSMDALRNKPMNVLSLKDFDVLNDHVQYAISAMLEVISKHRELSGDD